MRLIDLDDAGRAKLMWRPVDSPRPSGGARGGPRETEKLIECFPRTRSQR